MCKRLRGALSVWLCLALVGCAELGLDASAIGDLLGPAASDPSWAAGVREALRVSAERGVARAARPGGFEDNPVIRIGLPSELEEIGDALRILGLNGTVDELEETMNRAAEAASGEATNLLIDAVGGISIADAREIVRGPDDAATRYFRAQTEDALRTRFAPIVETTMRRVGLYGAYDELVQRHALLAMAGDPTLDLNRYVTERTLDGLFADARRKRRGGSVRTRQLARPSYCVGCSAGSEVAPRLRSACEVELLGIRDASGP